MKRLSKSLKIKCWTLNLPTFLFWEQIISRHGSKFLKNSFTMWLFVSLGFNPKTTPGSIWPPSLWFYKSVSSKERVILWFCDILYYHKSHLWNSSSRSNDMKNFSFNISCFHWFCSSFWIFWHFLVTKKLMTSAYNRWCQHFFTFNMLQIDCLVVV